MKTNIMAVALLGLAATLLSCSGKEAQKPGDNKEEVPVVKIAQVREAEVDQTQTFTASVDPESLNNISAASPNRIKAIYVDEGMRVSAGQRLVVLDDVNTSSYDAQVDNARANLRLAQANYDRAVQLKEIGGGTQQSVDQMEIQLVNAKNSLSTAERTLRNARENTILTAPISGVVTARNYDPGDLTGQLPILTIAQVQPVKAVINVSESDYSRISMGMPVSLTFQTYGDEEFQGRVTMIAPTVDTATRTFGVEVTIPNKDSRILPGMFGRATVNLGVQTHVLVPDRAVVKQPGSGNHYVYVYSNGHVSYDRVELGRRIGTEYELLSGVAPGAEVVVAGQAKLADGVAVKVAD